MLKIFKEMMQKDNADPEKANLLKEKHERKKKQYSSSRSKSDNKSISSRSERMKRFPFKAVQEPRKAVMDQSVEATNPYQSEKKDSWWFWAAHAQEQPPSKSKEDTCSCVSCALKKFVGSEYVCLGILVILFAVSISVAFWMVFKTVPCFGSGIKKENNAGFGDRMKRDDSLLNNYDGNMGNALSPLENLKHLEEASKFSELSNIFNSEKIEDIKDSEKLRTFYNKLVQTDARIRLLRKSFQDNISFEDKYKSDRVKRSLFNERKKESHKKEKRNASEPTGFVIEKKKIFVQYKPALSRKIPKCSHNPKDSKSHEKQLKHPFYKSSQRLDELLGRLLGTPEGVSHRFENKLFKAEKVNDSDKNTKPVLDVMTNGRGKLVAQKHKETGEYFDKASDDVENAMKTAESSVKDYFTDIEINDRVSKLPSIIKVGTTSSFDIIQSKYPKVRRLMQAEEDDVDIAYNDVKEVLSDDGTPHDDAEIVADRMKRSDERSSIEVPKGPLSITNPNWKAPILYPEEIKSIIKQAALHNYRVKNVKKQEEGNFNDVEYLENYLVGEDKRLSKMAQAYSDYGVLEGRKDAIRDGKNDNIDKPKDYRIKMAANDGLGRLEKDSEGIRFEYRPSPHNVHTHAQGENNPSIYKIIQKHVKFNKEENIVPSVSNFLSTVPDFQDLIHNSLTTETTLSYDQFKKKFSYKTDDTSDNGLVFTFSKGKRTLKSIPEEDIKHEYDDNYEDENYDEPPSIFVFEYVTSFKNKMPNVTIEQHKDNNPTVIQFNNNIKNANNVTNDGKNYNDDLDDEAMIAFEYINMLNKMLKSTSGRRNNVPEKDSKANKMNDITKTNWANIYSNDIQFFMPFKNFISLDVNASSAKDSKSHTSSYHILDQKNREKFISTHKDAWKIINDTSTDSTDNILSTDSGDALIRKVNSSFDILLPNEIFSNTDESISNDLDTDFNFVDTASNTDTTTSSSFSTNNFIIKEISNAQLNLLNDVATNKEVNETTLSETYFSSNFNSLNTGTDSDNKENIITVSPILPKNHLTDISDTNYNINKTATWNDVNIPNINNNSESTAIVEFIQKTNFALNDTMNESQQKYKTNSVNTEDNSKFKREVAGHNTKTNRTDIDIMDKKLSDAYMDVGDLLYMLSNVFATFDGIFIDQNIPKIGKSNISIPQGPNEEYKADNEINTTEYVSNTNSKRNITETLLDIVNNSANVVNTNLLNPGNDTSLNNYASRENEGTQKNVNNTNDVYNTNNTKVVYSIYDSDMIANIGHKSRVLLSINDSKTAMEQNENENSTQVSEKEMKDDSKVTEDFSNNTFVLINNSSYTTNITDSEKFKVTDTEKANKTVVKRNADSSLIFWNDLYDDEYGVKDEFENIRDKHSVHDHNFIKSSKMWITDKVKRITNNIKRGGRKLGGTKTAMPQISMNSRVNTSSIPNVKKNKINKRMIKIRDDDDQESEKRDFATLTANMKQVCKKAAQAVKETRNLKGREESRENAIATSLMSQLMKLATDLVDYQVQERTCLRLPKDLQKFLQWLTGSETGDNNQSRNENPMSIDNYEKPTVHELDIQSSQSTEKEDVVPARSDCLGTIQDVQDLLLLYDEMSDEDKSKMPGIREYLVNQMDYLQRLSYSDYNPLNNYYLLRFKRHLSPTAILSQKTTKSRPKRNLRKLFKTIKEKKTTIANYKYLPLTDGFSRDGKGESTVSIVKRPNKLHHGNTEQEKSLPVLKRKTKMNI